MNERPDVTPPIVVPLAGIVGATVVGGGVRTVPPVQDAPSCVLPTAPVPLGAEMLPLGKKKLPLGKSKLPLGR
jgi:hypothetical protein